MAYIRPKSTPREIGLALKSQWIFMLFCVFGGGTSWYATSLAGMALPMYQEAGLGLSLANKMEIGYNLGTLPWLLLLLCRVPSSKDVRRIWALLATQSVAISILCVATPGSPLFSPYMLIIAMFFGGSCGYGAQFVCVPYLLHFENRLVAAFWLGDSVTSVGSAVAAVLWRGFGLSIRSYMIVCGPVVVAASAIALWFIQRTESSIYQSDDAFQAVPTDDAEHQAISSRVRRCFPAHFRTALTLKLALIVFWSQFADWGVGDSIFPYACAQAGDKPRRVELCELLCVELSLAAQLVGTALAAALDLSAIAALSAPTLLYTFVFALLCAASFRDLRFGHQGVVLLIALLRFSGPYLRNVVPRLIQPNYPTIHHDHLAVYFASISVAGNLLGSFVVTLLIKANMLAH